MMDISKILEKEEDDLTEADLELLDKALDDELETSDEKDAKLSTQKRKSLPNSSFCGPGRSFPANDCAHVRAGFRLLNRYSGSDGTKSKIRSCLNRKNKSLSCNVKSGDSMDSFINYNVIDNVVKNHINLFDKNDTSEKFVTSIVSQLIELNGFTGVNLAKNIDDLVINVANSINNVKEILRNSNQDNKTMIISSIVSSQLRELYS